MGFRGYRRRKDPGRDVRTELSELSFLLEGSGLRVQGVGCRVKGVGCRVKGVGRRVWGVGCRV